MKIVLLLTSLSLVACSNTSPKTDDYLTHVTAAQDGLLTQQLKVLLDVNQPLDMRGEYNPDNGIGSNQILYAGDAGVVGLLAQIATHATINSNLQDAKLSQQQTEANKILLPLQPYLQTMTNSLLVSQNDGIRFDASAPDALISKPIFFMSQDNRTMILRHLVMIKSPEGKTGRKTKAQYQNIIEVSSVSAEPSKSPSYWTMQQGAMLKQTAQALYSKSLQIVWQDVNRKLEDNVRDQTYSFQFGSQQRTERAKLLKQDCDYVLLRNLRGWLMVIPATAMQNNQITCEASEEVEKTTTSPVTISAVY